MKQPEAVLALLQRRWKSNHPSWLLEVLASESDIATSSWPLRIGLESPTEAQAIAQGDGVGAWIRSWKNWAYPGEVQWVDRKWRSLGEHSVPVAVSFENATTVAQCVGQADRWQKAIDRSLWLCNRWPHIIELLPSQFSVLADYTDNDFQRLLDVVSWLAENPDSQLYVRQVPVCGIDTKWIEPRRSVVEAWVRCIRGLSLQCRGFYEVCGLKKVPDLLRIRILDPVLCRHFNGLSDFIAPIEQIAALKWSWEQGANRGRAGGLSHAFIVENVQSGMALPNIPGAIALIGRGYSLEVLEQIHWLQELECLYWGDLDTHGFVMLNMFRKVLPRTHSFLMDCDTLMAHRSLWVREETPATVEHLQWLTSAEHRVYTGLRTHQWGQAVRLEQERLNWSHVSARLFGSR